MEEAEKIRWEREHLDKITGWQAEWDIMENTKVLTFDYINSEGKKSKKTFYIPVN